MSRWFLFGRFYLDPEDDTRAVPLADSHNFAYRFLNSTCA